MGLLLLSVVVSSQPEAFHAHQQELLQLLIETLSEVNFPGVLFYSLRTLTAIARYLRPDDVVRHWLSHLNPVTDCISLGFMPSLLEVLTQATLEFYSAFRSSKG